jgi:hypothetical protein
MTNTRKETPFSTANSDGQGLRQPYSRRISLLRSVCVLDKWLEDNEGKIADEVRIFSEPVALGDARQRPGQMASPTLAGAIRTSYSVSRKG